MRLIHHTNRGLRIAAACLCASALFVPASLADEPQGGSRLARLFRLGGSSSSSSSNSSSSSSNHNHDHDAPASSKPTMSNLPTNATVVTTTPTQPPSTPDLSTSGPAPRITPHSRVSKPPTESDPVLTRVSLGRADNGTQFGMFIQVFADGTVIDGEGVHHVGADLMKPILDTLRQGDIYRIHGHCGNASADEIEAAQVVVYERSYGKLRATSFSYSGNPHGCDPSLHKLHKALEAIQMKLSHVSPSIGNAPAGPALSAPATTAAPVISGPAVTRGSNMPSPPAVNPVTGPVLSLTPPNS